MPAKMGGVIYALTAMEHRWSLEQIACEILRYSDNKLVHHDPVDGEVSKAVANFRSELLRMRKLERVPNDIKNVINDGVPSNSKSPKGFTRDQLEIILPHLSKPASNNLTKILVFPGDEPSGPLQGSLLDMLEQKPEIRPEPKQKLPKAELQQVLDLPQSKSAKTKKRETEFDCKQVMLDFLADGEWHSWFKRDTPERRTFDTKSRRSEIKPVCEKLIAEGLIEQRPCKKGNGVEYRLRSSAVKSTEKPVEVAAEVVELPKVGVDVVEPPRVEPIKAIAEVVEPPEAIDLYTRRQSRQAAMEGFDSSRIEEALSSAKALVWAQWQGEKWMTTKQVADYLGLSLKAIDSNFQRNRQEFLEAAEVRTLRGADLKGFREVTCFEQVTSKEPVVAKFAPSTNVYSKAGVLRMAWMSDGPMGRAVRDFTMKLVHSLPAMVEQGVKLGRDQRLDTMTSSDLAHGVVVERLEGIESKVDQSSSKIDELTDKVDRLEFIMAQTHRHAEVAAVNSERAASKGRNDFQPKVKSKIAICYYQITGDGLDLFDKTQLVYPDGTWTQNCEFDHVNANSNISNIRNCMPLSKSTHKLKSAGNLTIEQREKLNRYHLNVLDRLDKNDAPLFNQTPA